MKDNKPRYAVQHEMDEDPTYVVDKQDPEENPVVEISTSLHWKVRLEVAHAVAAILNKQEGV